MLSCNPTPSVQSRPFPAPPPPPPRSTVSLQPVWGHSGRCHPPSQTDGRTGRKSHIMEALYIQPWEKEEATMMEEELESGVERVEGGTEASSTPGSDEETDDDSDTEPSPVIRRKVSFADAFGLNLVSVKEFDNVDMKETEVDQLPEKETNRPLEEVYLTCLFAVPSSQEELDQRLQTQMVELESIELLPGTSTIRGIVRVVNLCYSKTVHVRMSLDRWQSHFDFPAEYVPGSSDRRTDRFTFRHDLVPPFQRDGSRVEFCLRYDTSVGTFWANNKEMNYVLFCHQRGLPSEQTPEETGVCRSKRSCLKANRRGSPEEKARETSNTSPVAGEAEALGKAEEANREMIDGAQIKPALCCKESKALVDGIKSRHRATRLARVQDSLAQRTQHIPTAYSHDSSSGCKFSQPLPTPWGYSGSSLHRWQKELSIESPQVLTYHEIPLLTLDWNANKAHQWGTAEMDDIWTRSTEKSLRKASGENKEDTLSVNDKWEMFCNGTDKNASVFEVWQQFLNGSGSASDSSIPESEWLQTATSVLPSNDKEAKTWYAGRSQDCGFQVGLEPPTTSHAHISTSCHLLSDTCKTSLDNVALNTADRQPGQPCVGSPTDDNTGTRDASGRSETNSVTDTLQEFSPEGLPLVSKGDVESSTEWHKHEVWEIIEGVGGDKPFEPNTADLVTSSGELETTDVAATAECRNARAVDRISRMDELLSSSQERQETGTKNDMMDDRLAFKETVRQDTNIGERFVFLASRQGVEEAIMNNCMENKASTGEEIFRPQKTEECEISQRYADEKQRDEFRLNRNIEKPLRQDEVDEKEARPAQSQVVEFSANRSGDEDSERRQMTASKVKCEESGNVDVALNDKDVVAFKKTMALPSCSTTSKEMERVTDLQQWENSTIISGACNGQSRPIPTGEEIHNQTKEEESKAAPIQEDVQPESETGECQLREGNQRSCDGQTRPTMESREKIKVLLSGHEASGSFPSDECYTNTLEGIKMTCSHLHEDAKGQEEDPGHGISQEVTMKEDIDTTAELQRQPEILQETEEDLSQTDRDEKVSIRKLKIATPVESMGNPGFSWGASKNAEAQLKEQELPEVESSSHVECKRFSEGIKDPIRADETTALEGIESELGKTFVERFGDDLIKRVWKEVFNLKARASKRDLKTADLPQNMKESFPLEEDLSNISESCVFVLRGNSSLCQGLEQTLAAKSNEDSPRERGQSVVPAEQSHILSGLQRDSDSSAHFGQELASTGLHDQEKYTQVKERSVTHQEIRRQTEKHVVDPPDCLTYKPSSSEKLEESLCWSVLYILVHITRLVICILFVVGFFYIVYLCDFPAFFALYIFSLGWWFYKWKRHRGATNKSMAVD